MKNLFPQVFPLLRNKKLENVPFVHQVARREAPLESGWNINSPNNILAGGDGECQKISAAPTPVFPTGSPCPGRGGIGRLALGHLCLSPPASDSTSGLAERIWFGWVVREALEIPTALQGTEWVLGTRRGHLGPMEEGVQRWGSDGEQRWGQWWLIPCSATQKWSDKVRKKEGFDTEYLCPKERELCNLPGVIRQCCC